MVGTEAIISDAFKSNGPSLTCGVLLVFKGNETFPAGGVFDEGDH